MGSVNVLAVLDSIIEMHPEWEVSAEKVSEVRAAVAELIEAALARDTAVGNAIRAEIQFGLGSKELQEAQRDQTEAHLRYYEALATAQGGTK